MADITMCTQVTCPLASRCYRRTAVEGQHQSWAEFNWFDWDFGYACDHYVPTADRSMPDGPKIDGDK